MSQRFFHFAFGIGLAAVLWVGYGFIGASWLALAMTLAIAAAFLLGAFELRRFRAVTAALATALADDAQPPAGLAAWLERVPPSLRHAVRLRIEGERGGALPGPALTPYLVGLLVMLGMLGTFLGMVITFQGAVFALEGSADLQAIRSALAAPLKGLGLSFGTSVAGVAASAMLGLMSAIARRERLEVASRLDARIATVLLPFSLVHQRQETFRALQAQARSLPDVGQQLVALMEKIDERASRLDARLLERHEALQSDMTRAYDELAQRVGKSLEQSLADGARAAGDSIAPVIESAMARMTANGESLQAAVAGNLATLGQALEQPITRMLQTAHEVPQAAAGVIHELRQQMARVAERENLALAERGQLLERYDTLQRDVGKAYDELAQRVGTSLEQSLAAGARAAGESVAPVIASAMARMTANGESLQAAVADNLATLGQALEQPITRLLQVSHEVPQAAAGVIGELRQEMARVAERENLALAERGRLLEGLSALLQSVEQAAGEQRTATAQVNGSALEVAGLAQSFGDAVQQFQAGSEKLAESLQRVEASLERSTARSDEQLAYYVAQAREVIDLSISSQQAVLEAMRQADAPPARARA